MDGKKIGKGLLWKLMERFGVQGVQFILQIILARLLNPEHYGALSLMIIFTTIANVLIQNGFNTALIQNKDVQDEDYSSVFWVTLMGAAGIYGILFLCAPLIAAAYKMPDLVWPLRVLALMLFPGAMNSVQLAKVSREMNFKKVFFSNIGGILVSGIVGIIIAYRGGGLWALVAQTLLNIVVVCIVMFATVRWRPRLVLNFKRIGTLFSFGWKLMVSSLIDTLYQDVRSLVIGLKYSSATLGYYNRGKQFPQFLINSVNGAVQSVMLPAMSAEQENKYKVKSIMRNAVMMSAYIIFPIMAGLAGVAEPLVKVLLTDKWLPCVPYLQIYCFSFAFYPVHTSNLQAINAMGRSDIFLKLEIIKKSIGLSALAIAVFCFKSPIAIALTGAITTLLSCFINAAPNRKLIDYSYFEQMRDILPSFGAALGMLAAVLAIGLLPLAPIYLLLIQIPAGIAAYLLISVVFRMRAFGKLWGMAKKFLKK
jgi:O-antigen/teichoic acid export membrane protein